MPWNPETYNQFKNIRYQPFFDLMAMVATDGLSRCVDIGCGTGEQTKILAEKSETASFLGIDPSPEMLSQSQQFNQANLRFEKGTVEDFIDRNTKQSWDLIFSNAALQWSNDHENLFTNLIALISPNGQLAIQMPVQNENMLNRILLQLVQERPFSDYLNNYKRESPLLTIDQYAQIMFQCGLGQIQIIQKVYPIIADSADILLDFISGSALIPYMERLSPDQQQELTTEFRKRIDRAFGKFPAIYAFKRLLLYGRK